MSSTATALLDKAQELVQARGFNAFSYNDLAEAIGIKKASIHYHFRSKGDLGKALITRYVDRLEETLDAIEATHDTSRARLGALVDTYRSTEQRGALCLCGSMASDVGTLPEAVAQPVHDYLHRTETWIAATIDRGAARGEWQPRSDAADLGTLFVASLQGALLVSRTRADQDASALEQTLRALMALLPV